VANKENKEKVKALLESGEGVIKQRADWKIQLSCGCWVPERVIIAQEILNNSPGLVWCNRHQRLVEYAG